MNSTDWFFSAVIVVIIAACVGAIGLSFTGQNQSTTDVTPNYALPQSMAGCRVYRMVPAGFGQTLYVISRDGQPVAAEWDEQHGKTTRRVWVVSP